jgi:aarF domain-containing kinase
VLASLRFAPLRYPGIKDAIDSDLGNLQTVISYTNLIPKGVFINDIITEGRKELSNECDYRSELRSQSRFHALVAGDRELPSLGFTVPRVAPHLSTAQVLVSEFAFGYTIDRCADLPGEVRDRIAKGVLRTTLLELFVWRFMQTDPNWGNFIYDPTTERVALIDFGGARDFDKGFVDG